MLRVCCSGTGLTAALCGAGGVDATHSGPLSASSAHMPELVLKSVADVVDQQLNEFAVKLICMGKQTLHNNSPNSQANGLWPQQVETEGVVHVRVGSNQSGPTSEPTETRHHRRSRPVDTLIEIPHLHGGRPCYTGPARWRQSTPPYLSLHHVCGVHFAEAPLWPTPPPPSSLHPQTAIFIGIG